MGIAGGGVNLLAIPFFLNEFNLVLSSFIVYVVAVYRGAGAALMVSLVSGIPLVITTGNIYPLIVYAIEALVVSLVYAKLVKNLLFSVLFYWLIAGLLLSSYFGKSFIYYSESESQLIYIKFIFDAILNISIATIFISNNIGRKWLTEDPELVNHSLRKIIAAHFSAVLLFVSVVSANFLLSLEIKQSHNSMIAEMRSLKNDIDKFLNKTINTRTTILKEVAVNLSKIWHDSAFRSIFLKDSHKRLNFFNSMLIADNKGDVLSYSLKPWQDADINTDSLNLSDRRYFVEAMTSDNVYISEGLKGKGLGVNLIVTMSQSVPGISPGTHMGLIQGAMLLKDLSSINDILNESPEKLGLLIDQNDNVLFASEYLQLSDLSHFKIKLQKDRLYGAETSRLIVDGKPYFYSQSEFDWGWKILLLNDGRIFLDVVDSFMKLFIVVIIFLVLFVEYFSYWLSKYLTKQLTKLSNAIKYIGFDYHSKEEINKHSFPDELKVIYKSIESSNKEVKLVKQNLYDSLKVKAQQYKEASMQLKELEYKDYLTKLDNREMFNKTLKKIWKFKTDSYEALSVVVVSINKFDELNEMWGSQFSDNLLIQVSRQILSLKQHYNCAARVSSARIILLDDFHTHTETVDFAENVRTKINELQFIHSEENIYSMVNVSVSIGVVTVDPYRSTIDEFLKLVQDALTEASNSKDNSIKTINKSILI